MDLRPIADLFLFCGGLASKRKGYRKATRKVSVQNYTQVIRVIPVITPFYFGFDVRFTRFHASQIEN